MTPESFTATIVIARYTWTSLLTRCSAFESRPDEIVITRVRHVRELDQAKFAYYFSKRMPH
jgi:hypothetical protein